MKKLWQWIKCKTGLHWTYQSSSQGYYRYCKVCGKCQYRSDYDEDWR